MNPTALGRSSAYKQMKEGLPSKPAMHIGGSVAWVEKKVQEGYWIRLVNVME